MKTVKVRIAVAVTKDGDWNATGWKDARDDVAMELAVETVASGEARYWLEAELEIPEDVVVPVPASASSAEPGQVERALQALAAEIADDLFTNGSGQKSTRLVMELPDGKDGGGWCHQALTSRVAKHLLGSQAKP